MSSCGISLRRLLSHLQLKRLMLYKLLNGYFSHDSHCSKCFNGTASTTIGIKLWFAPQISEHWPKNTPVRDDARGSWFSRPGTASTFTPRDGTAHECSTSSAVTTTRVWRLAGITIRWSTSSNRGDPFGKSCV